MSTLLDVILLGSAMFIATFLFGYLPTRIKTSQRLMNLIAIYGAGLLVGAAFVVIIPEGMLILFTAITEYGKIPQENGDLTAIRSNVTSLHAAAGDSVVNPHMTKFVGASLIFGFTLMLLLDQGYLMLKEWAIKNETSHSHKDDHSHHHHHNNVHENEQRFDLDIKKINDGDSSHDNSSHRHDERHHKSEHTHRSKVNQKSKDNLQPLL